MTFIMNQCSLRLMVASSFQGLLIKPNFVISGKNCFKQYNIEIEGRVGEVIYYLFDFIHIFSI